MLASSAYETSVLVEGRGSMQLLKNLAARSADDVSESSDGDMCIDVEGTTCVARFLKRYSRKGGVDQSPKVYTQLARQGVVLTQDSDNI